MAKKTTLVEFEAIFPQLEEVILQHANKYKLPEKELAWLKEARCLPPSSSSYSPSCLNTSMYPTDQDGQEKRSK